MLQHSRPSAGKKEPIKIKTLVNEHLKVPYQGFCVEDKTFSATIKTDFDESIGKVEIVPQEIALVLLNLYNNAFYAVNEKKKQLNASFEPTVEVSTKKQDGKVEIHVKDNGTGIPQKVLDKIYQPFVTTKATGHGTGLGLPLSYDIIKAHSGEIKVETKQGEGSEFIIQLTNG